MLKEEAQMMRRLWILEDKVEYLSEKVPEAFIAGWSASKTQPPENMHKAYKEWKEQ